MMVCISSSSMPLYSQRGLGSRGTICHDIAHSGSRTHTVQSKFSTVQTCHFINLLQRDLPMSVRDYSGTSTVL